MILREGVYGYADLALGAQIETGARQVTAEQIDAFADLTWDRYAIHMDDAAAQARGFARRVAHGLLILSIIDGLKNTASARIDALASLGWSWDFAKPVFADDTICAAFRVAQKHRTSSGARGIITLDVEVYNQHSDTVQAGQNRLIFDF